MGKYKTLTQVSKNFNVRHGAIAQKIGMTSVWHNGERVGVTLLKISNLVFAKKHENKDGYNAVVIGYGDAVKITKPQAGILHLITGDNRENQKDLDTNNNITSEDFKNLTKQTELPTEWKDLQYKKVSFSKLKEFRTDLLNEVQVGTKISADYFQINQLVNVSGVSIGKGFAGGMKRHNFRGLEASHGVSISHRSSGSTGQRQDPGKTFKGKKMPGHLGNVKCNVENLKVLGHYHDNDVLVVKGSIPGCNGSFIEIKDAVKS